MSCSLPPNGLVPWREMSRDLEHCLFKNLPYSMGLIVLISCIHHHLDSVLVTTKSSTIKSIGLRARFQPRSRTMGKITYVFLTTVVVPHFVQIPSDFKINLTYDSGKDFVVFQKQYPSLAIISFRDHQKLCCFQGMAWMLVHP